MRSFLQQVASMFDSTGSSKYHSLYSWVLKHGTDFASSPLTPEERKIVKRAAGRKKFPLGCCFQNAQKLVLSDKTGTMAYCEGFALKAGLIPLHHGWATINGKVVDLTWLDDSRGQIIGEFAEGWCYFGATFDRDRTAAQHLSRCTSILDDWTDRSIMLRE